MKNKKMIIIIVVAAIVVIGGVIGGIAIYNHVKESEAQRVLDEQRNELVQGYNGRITQIITGLSVPDANGQNPSLDNNNDVNVMWNALTQLDAIKADVNKDIVITDEQKNNLNQIADTQKQSITVRINAVNQAKAEAEAKAKEEAEIKAKAEAEAKAKQQAATNNTNKTSNKTSSNTTKTNSTKKNTTTKTNSTKKKSS